MIWIKKISLQIIFIASFSYLYANDIAVLLGNFSNLPTEDSKTLTMILAKKYSEVANKNVYDITKAQQIYKENNYNIVSTTENMEASEYIVFTAITLNKKILIDCILYDEKGNKIFKTERELESIDDFPGSCDNIVESLFSKAEIKKSPNIVSIEEEESLTDEGDDEEKDENFKLFQEKIIGFKIGGMQPFHSDTSFEPHITVGFSMKIENKNFFIEFGAGPLLPMYFDYFENSDHDLRYTGVNIEMGAFYYLTNNSIASVFLGGGLNPRILIEPSQAVMNPYISFGVMFLRNNSTRIFTNIKILQNALNLVYQKRVQTDPFFEYETIQYKVKPFEIGLELGAGW